MDIRGSKAQFEQAFNRLGRHTKIFIEAWVAEMEEQISTNEKLPVQSIIANALAKVIDRLRQDQNIVVTAPMRSRAIELLMTYWQQGHLLRSWQKQNPTIVSENSTPAVTTGSCARLARGLPAP